MVEVVDILGCRTLPTLPNLSLAVNSRCGTATLRQRQDSMLVGIVEYRVWHQLEEVQKHGLL